MFKYSLKNNMFIRVAQTDGWTDGQHENIMSNYALLFIPILFYYFLLLWFFLAVRLFLSTLQSLSHVNCFGNGKLNVLNTLEHKNLCRFTMPKAVKTCAECRPVLIKRFLVCF